MTDSSLSRTQANGMRPADKLHSLDGDLRQLTEELSHVVPDEVAHALLGGEFGYGARYENDVFMMHPFCWCEAEDCPWCEHDAANFQFKATGAEVRWYKYIGRSMEASGELPLDWLAICVRSLPERVA